MIKLRVISPERKCFDGEAQMLSVMGESGSLSVMEGHIPLVTPVKKGKVRIYLQNGDVINAFSDGGLLTVRKDETVLLIENFKADE